jgi:hypothetical protein
VSALMAFMQTARQFYLLAPPARHAEASVYPIIAICYNHPHGPE